MRIYLLSNKTSVSYLDLKIIIVIFIDFHWLLIVDVLKENLNKLLSQKHCCLSKEPGENKKPRIVIGYWLFRTNHPSVYFWTSNV